MVVTVSYVSQDHLNSSFKAIQHSCCSFTIAVVHSPYEQHPHSLSPHVSFFIWMDFIALMTDSVLGVQKKLVTKFRAAYQEL